MEVSFITDLPYLYLFWLTVFLIGIINLPITVLLFKSFGDRGYIFSKVIGIIFISYSVWLLSSLKIAAFTQNTVIGTTLLLVLINLFVLYRQMQVKDFKFSSFPIKTWILEELLFLAVFAFWSTVRGFNPEIHGLEKFMDFGFVNSILKTSYMPPLDMWLSESTSPGNYTGSFSINYYYFGHYVTALLTKLSTVPAQITYNLMLGLLCAFTFSGSFSIAANLFYRFRKSIDKPVDFFSKKIIVCGMLAGSLVAFGGNLHTIYAFTKGYDFDKPQPIWEVLGKPNIDRYWYPNATRFIPNTIHEFPIYSFVVSDLHGHVLDIPFVFLIIAFLFSLYLTVKDSNGEKMKSGLWNLFGSWNGGLVTLVILGLFIAVSYMTNAWDGIIYFGLSVMVFVIILVKIGNKSDNKIGIFPNIRINILSKTITFPLSHFIWIAGIVGISYLLFSLPFNKNFVPFAKGIGINCITPNSANQVLCDHSPWWMMLILWGYFYFFALTFLWTVIRPRLKSIEHKITTSDIFVTLLIIISTGLLIAPELIFARDIYPAHYRANTMFKLGYQAFMMLGICVAYIFFRFTTISPFTKTKTMIKSLLNKIWWIAAFVILFLVLLYPFFATNSYYNGLRVYQGLDGLTWLWKIHPGDLATVEYFKNTLAEKDQPNILEAVGQSYTDYARISANTGLPTILGWPVHEWLWRGSYDESGKREAEVKSIYEAQNTETAKALLDKYNITYVILGDLERDQYPNLNEDIFYNLGDIVFQAGNTQVFKLRK